ncbi:MAG TPA: helix-turn-helix domain-containing protein [Actinomycetota bacterium]|nr:helix-turn-helix domain-containing protein [Actinomycetota bacterium]
MKRDDGSDSGCEELRADAERNRQLLLQAAREVFADQGLDASSKEIARRAGVGIATLYRRFPTRQDLLVATFGPKLAAYTEAIDRALKDPDLWRGFCDYLTAITAMQQGDRGFRDILTQAFPNARELRAQRDHVYHGVAELIERAKATGRLREDFVPEDVPLLLMANAGVVAATAEHAPESSDRLVGYLLQAFASAAASELPQPATPQRMYRALTRHQPG